MEWVETTGKTLQEAKERALDQLGVAEDDAEFDVLEEPKTGLFGRVRGEARVRARIRPTAVRPKQERRNRAKGKPRQQDPAEAATSPGSSARDGGQRSQRSTSTERTGARQPKNATQDPKPGRPARTKETAVSQDEFHDPTVTPEQVGEAAAAFMAGLASAIGAEATTSVAVDGTDLEVHLNGSGLGLLVGPSGNTLLAVQDLARVASQRRLGDHDTRLKVDVAGYRERRREALEKFTLTVATQVIETGTTKALEPMSSADRKVVHDTVLGIDGVTSHSEGDDPSRRVVITLG